MAKIKMKKQEQPRGVKWLDSVVYKNTNLDFIKRAMDEKTPSVVVKGQTEPSTHFMESSDGMVYPTVVNHPREGLIFMGEHKGVDKKGRNIYNTDKAYNYAKQSGNYIKFDNDRDAQYFAENYKNSNLIKIGKPKK